MSTANISKKRKVCICDARFGSTTVARPRPRGSPSRRLRPVAQGLANTARGPIDRLEPDEGMARPSTNRRRAVCATRVIE
jgi:hypothetical protein